MHGILKPNFVRNLFIIVDLLMNEDVILMRVEI